MEKTIPDSPQADRTSPKEISKVPFYNLLPTKFLRESHELTWIKRLISLYGLWPIAPKKSWFVLYIIYLVPYHGLQYVSFFRHYENFERTVRSMTELIPTMMMLIKSLMFRRKIKLLAKLLDFVHRDISNLRYRTADEQEAVLYYSLIAKIYFLFCVPLTFGVVLMLYVLPIVKQLTRSRNEGNITIPYEMSYQISFYYDITELRYYVLTCIYQLPSPFMYIVGVMAPDSLLVVLIMHISGQLTVLALRIKNISQDLRIYHRDIKNYVQRHLELIRMAELLEDAFSNLLLVQSSGLTFVNCVLGYVLMRMMESGEGENMVQFIFFFLAVIMLAFTYCFAGECLLNASSTVHEACYHSKWYDLPGRSAQIIILCMVRSQRPLRLTAGKFYAFSLETFTTIMNASMAYFSVLRGIA